MDEISQVLNALESGDPHVAHQLLPLVYKQLRNLAAEKIAQEKPGQTLQATALVHEAYLRVAGGEKSQHWNGRNHFFAAAAEAMRRILIERARRKRRAKHGGSRQRIDLDEALLVAVDPSDDLLALDEALSRLEGVDPVAAQLVKLRYFAGLSMPQVAAALGLPLRTAERNWTYARAWLHRELFQSDPPGTTPR